MAICKADASYANRAFKTEQCISLVVAQWMQSERTLKVYGIGRAAHIKNIRVIGYGPT